MVELGSSLGTHPAWLVCPLVEVVRRTTRTDAYFAPRPVLSPSPVMAELEFFFLRLIINTQNSWYPKFVLGKVKCTVIFFLGQSIERDRRMGVAIHNEKNKRFRKNMS